jgi:DNA invertase Pin-like site-specific DNA recombinase/transposase
MKSDVKITSSHLDRKAYIYIRQSTEHQVRKNIESQQRQYELVDLAKKYKWTEDSIIVIDDDLGRSGSSTYGRSGFAKLVADVALKKAGIIFGIEVSRLARNNKDWYQLLDLCSLTATLIGDADGIYDPCCFNDRLLLGLKGTMSEAELYMIKSRMQQGLYHKAQKGELRFHLPAGYQFDNNSKIIKILDEQVTHIIDLTFKKFFEIGTVHGVVKYFLANNLQFPRNATFDKKIRWVRPYYRAVRSTLGNPLYSGTYVFGRTKVIKELDATGNQKLRIITKNMEDWDVIIHDHHPAYITWEQYLEIQKQIQKNISPPKDHASRVVREGSALLQGIVRCGNCGRSMSVSYHGQNNQSYHYYRCNKQYHSFAKSFCQAIGGRRIDKTVSEIFLETISPASLNIQLKAMRQIDQQQDTALDQLKLQLERAQYEADRAFRQFDAIEPENRLVARPLERKWNEGLKHVEQLKAQIKERKNSLEDRLSNIEEKQILRLARDLLTIWNAPTTSNKDKKKLIGSAIQEVQLTKTDREVAVKIIWKGGAVIDTIVFLPKIGRNSNTSTEVVELVRQLAPKFTDAQIARILIRQGHKTATGLPYNAHRVACLRWNFHVPCYKKPKDEPIKTFTAQEAAQILQVSIPTIHNWIDAGFIKGEQITVGAPWEIPLTEEDIKRLTAEETPAGWLPLSQAGQELGVSKQTVLNWVKSKKLEYIYVNQGRKKGLRINTNSKTYKKQLSLFS